MHAYDSSPASQIPRGMTAIGVFLEFGALMASLAGISFVWPGTALDRMWILNQSAYYQLVPFGRAVGALFLLLAVLLAVAGVGWLRHRKWGWWLAVVIITTQAFSDFVNALSGHLAEGIVGGTIATALLFYMTRAYVRSAFRRHSETD